MSTWDLRHVGLAGLYLEGEDRIHRNPLQSRAASRTGSGRPAAVLSLWLPKKRRCVCSWPRGRSIRRLLSVRYAIIGDAMTSVKLSATSANKVPCICVRSMMFVLLSVGDPRQRLYLGPIPSSGQLQASRPSPLNLDEISAFPTAYQV